MNKSKNIVIIPARGGAKRFPRKNVIFFDKIPMIVHSINYAKANYQVVDEIIVSTDDKDIKRIALEHDIKVIDRPVHLSGDTEPTVTALRHVLNKIDVHFDNVILLQVTNPLRPVKLLQNAYQNYTKGNYDSLMTVSRNYDKLGKIENNKFIPFNYEIGQRSQDLEPLYYENGLLYITKTDLILEGKIIGGKCLPYITTHPFSKVDIDLEEDLIYAQFILENYHEK